MAKKIVLDAAGDEPAADITETFVVAVEFFGYPDGVKKQYLPDQEYTEAGEYVEMLRSKNLIK